MNSDHYNNYNECQRVRQIPILVETRDGQRSRGTNTHSYNQYDNSTHHNADSYDHASASNNHHNDNRSASQNQQPSYTSNVNIETRPRTNPKSRQVRQNQKQTEASSSPNQSNSNPASENQVFREPRPSGGQHQPVNNHQGEEKSLKQQTDGESIDLVEADPTEPIPLPPPPVHDESQSANDDKKPPNKAEIDAIMDKIITVKRKAMDLVKIIEKFEYKSTDTKEFRYIEEMLTRCVLELDQLECGQLPELRQQRKDLVKSLEQASKVLHKKVELNASIADLFLKMKA